MTTTAAASSSSSSSPSSSFNIYVWTVALVLLALTSRSSGKQLSVSENFESPWSNQSMDDLDETCRRRQIQFRNCVQLIVSHWHGSGKVESCCRLQGFQQCRSKMFPEKDNSVPTTGCSVVSGVDLADIDPMFVEILLQPVVMDTMIKRNCEEFECHVHDHYSLLNTLLIFFACIVIFALISLLIMNRFSK